MYYSDENYKLIPIPAELEDYCDFLIYDGVEFTVDEIAKFNFMQECKIQEIKSKWQEKIDLHFAFNGNTFKCCRESLARIGARLAHSNTKTTLLTAEKTYYDVDRNAIEFIDKAAFEDFCIGLIEHRNTLDQHAEDLKHQAILATNEIELESIDLETGW